MQRMLKASSKILTHKLSDDQLPTGTQTFTQRVVVRFLQPPPVPPPGVSVSEKQLSMIRR